jgi:hypothetical protein
MQSANFHHHKMSFLQPVSYIQRFEKMKAIYHSVIPLEMPEICFLDV